MKKILSFGLLLLMAGSVLSPFSAFAKTSATGLAGNPGQSSGSITRVVKKSHKRGKSHVVRSKKQRNTQNVGAKRHGKRKTITAKKGRLGKQTSMPSAVAGNTSDGENQNC